MGNESSSSADKQHGGHQSSRGRIGSAAAAAVHSVNRPIGSDSSPPQSNFSLQSAAAAAAAAAASTDDGAALQSATSSSISSVSKQQQHRIVVVNSGPRPDAISNELRALGTLPTFLPLIKSSATAGSSSGAGTAAGKAAAVAAAAAAAAASTASTAFVTASAEAAIGVGGAGVTDRVDHRSLLHFCARYQEHLKQCAEAVAFDQNSLCGRIRELDAGAKAIQDSLQERHKRFQRLAEQIRKVTELRNLLARMRSHARHLGCLMEELNAQLPPDCQLEPFSWQSTLPQQQQQQADGAAAAAAAGPSAVHEAHAN